MGVQLVVPVDVCWHHFQCWRGCCFLQTIPRGLHPCELLACRVEGVTFLRRRDYERAGYRNLAFMAGPSLKGYGDSIRGRERKEIFIESLASLRCQESERVDEDG